MKVSCFSIIVLGALIFLAASASGDFKNPVTYSVGNCPSQGASADFNDDGFIDLAVADSCGDVVKIMLNNGLGNFQTGLIIQTEQAPAAVIARNFNNSVDEYVDLVVANYESSSIQVFTNNGFDGGNWQGFDLANTYTCPQPTSLTAHAFLGYNNRFDLAVGCEDDPGVWMYYNDGYANFVQSGQFSVGVLDYGANSLTSADFDENGLPDIAVACADPADFGLPGTVSILLNQGGGSFSPAVNYEVLWEPRQIITSVLDEDLEEPNADLSYDIAVIDYIGTKVSIFYNDGYGNFPSQPEEYSMDYYFSSIAFGDFNTDRLNDLAVSETYGNRIIIMTNNGPGDFPSNLWYYEMVYNPNYLIVDFFDNDFGPDIVSLQEFTNMSVLLNNNHGVYVCGDANGDKSVDIADAVYIINYVFRGGPPPDPIQSGDANLDFSVNVGDAVYIINFVFKGGPAPKCPYCPKPKIAVMPNGYTGYSRVSANFDGNNTVIEIESDIDLYGLEIELKCDNPGDIRGLNENMPTYVGHREGHTKVGLIDLDGKGYIESGKSSILQVEGRAELVSVSGADITGTYYELNIDVAEKAVVLPDKFELHGNYPNPFNPGTGISFSLPVATDVRLEVYNIAGQVVETLVDGYLEAGTHVVTWDGSEAGSGIYFYRINAGEFSDSKKMVLLK